MSLTASNASGQRTLTQNNYISVNATPAADFAFYKVWGVVGAETTAEFRTSSTNNPTSWSWTFGDGGTDTVQNPTHTYTSPGTYNVALTATTPRATTPARRRAWCTSCRSRRPSAPRLPSGWRRTTVTFTDQSTGTPTSWSWIFGDGGTSTAQNPSHTYSTTGYFSPEPDGEQCAGHGHDDSEQLHHHLQRGDRLSDQLLHGRAGGRESAPRLRLAVQPAVGGRELHGVHLGYLGRAEVLRVPASRRPAATRKARSRAAWSSIGR